MRNNIRSESQENREEEQEGGAKRHGIDLLLRFASLHLSRKEKGI